MRDTIELAREVGMKFSPAQFSGVLEAEIDEFSLKDFEALVRADERAQALAAPTVQEPAGEAKHMNGVSAAHTQAIFLKSEVPVGTLLYTTPPAAQRQWVGLTDEEIKLQWSVFWEAECHPWAIDFARAIESKLRKKNT
jgi:hypothetical protein